MNTNHCLSCPSLTLDNGDEGMLYLDRKRLTRSFGPYVPGSDPWEVPEAAEPAPF